MIKKYAILTNIQLFLGSVFILPYNIRHVPFCSSCGIEVAPDVQFCSKCGKPIKEMPSPTTGTTPTKRPSRAWYLLPIFFGIIGGLIMFLVIKDENRDMAKKGIILGAIMTIVELIIYGIIYAAMLTSLSSLY